MVYRARRGELPVAVKIERERTGAAGAVGARSELLREAAILGRVRHPALPEVMEVGETEGRLYLVMELVEGPTLASLLEGGPLPQPDVVALGKTLATALAALHRAGLVHRDVKPHNVVLPAAAPGAAKLVDFGFAGPAETRAGEDAVTGTLRYSAPEQTGMLKRPVDGRSDLYALGALLFECATGRPPFESEDAGALLRAHATQPAPAATALNPAVTPAMAAILARLLSKDPDDRYQTGGGLLRDLNRIERLDALLRAGEAVSLGGSDRAPRQSEETPLIGREAAHARLQEAWRETLLGRGRTLLVRGAAGAGKSRLVWEFLRGVRPQGGRVFHGRGVEQAPLPLAALREAVDDWLRQLRQLPRPERAAAEARLRDAAGQRAPLLRKLSPLLAQTLATPDAPADAERFHEAVADLFIQLLTDRGRGPAGGAVLFLDDAQWLDDGARAVLERIAARARGERILIVCAARDDGPDADTALAAVRTALGGAGGAGGAGGELAIGPLEPPDVGLLVAAHLGGYVPDEALVARIAALSNGNPFAVGEYVRALLDEGVLRPSWGSWVVDEVGLGRLHLPAGVMQLLALRVAALSERTRDVLAAAAVVGPRFSPATLADVCGLPLDTVHEEVATAVRARLIEPARGRGDYAIVHDQVRQVLEARLDAAQRRALHHRAAQALERAAPDAGDSADAASAAELIYRVAGHYALGEIERDPRRVFEACRAAGTAALRAYADDEALRFLRTSHRVMTEHALPLSADVALELEETLGQLCVRCARWDDAVAHLRAALPRAADGPRRARLRCQLAEVYFSNRDLTLAWAEIRQGFDEIGERFPISVPAESVTSPDGGAGSAAGTRRRQLRGALGTLRAWALAVAPRLRLGQRALSEPERERLRTLVALYAIAAHVAYLDNRGALMAQVVLRALLPARRLGPSYELATTFVAYAMLLGTLGQPRLAARAAARAVATAQQIGDRAALGRALAGQAWARHVAGFPRDAEALMRRALEEHGQWMSAQDFISGCTDLAWNLSMRGHAREAWHWISRALGRSQQANKRGQNLASNAAALLTVLGETDEAAAYLERARQVAEVTPEATWRLGDFLARLTHVCVERDELGRALDEAGTRHRACGFRPQSATFHARHFYVYWAYAQLARCMRPTSNGVPGAALTPESLALLRAACDDLRKAGPHPTLRCHALVVEGALLRLSGKRAAAALLLDRAERLATATDNPWALFEIHRQRAHACAAAGADDAAKQNGGGGVDVGVARRRVEERAAQHARRALELATAHGWVNRARWIRREFRAWSDAPRAFAPSSGTPELAAPARPPEGAMTRSQRRTERHLDALLKVSAAMGAALDPDHIARVALDQVLAILGAERAYLFLCTDYSEELTFTAGRDASLRDLDGAAGSSPSRTVLDQLRATRRPVLVSSGVSGGREGLLTASESIVARDVRSVAAVPLLMPGRLVGALYLDSRIASGVFHEDDVAVLQAIAGHIAVAVTVGQAFVRQAALAEENGQLLEQLSEQVEELQRSRQRITEAEERQKREISELLHGRVQTKLLLAAHRLAELQRLFVSDPSKAAQLVDGIRAELDEIREQDVRKASHLLHPTIIRLGLVPALHLLAERFEPQFRIKVSASPEIARLDDPIENRLSESLRLGAYRMVEEALGNAAKHAAPNQVEILLLREQDQLVLRVRDDGRGFDPDALRPGLGLGSIDGRVDQLGGTWDLSGTPGGGATLTVRLPLDAS